MYILRCFRIVILLCGAFPFSGCVPTERRFGLDPVIHASKVEYASDNKQRLLNSLAADAKVNLESGDGYYAVAEAGFNYIDDECNSYFNELFFLDRGREGVKSGLTAAGQTTAAILGITGASATSLAVVAQAFGFGIRATDLIAGTYLYQLPPATTQGFVQELQSAFRDAAAAQRSQINNPTTAYHLIQRYLDLCLPPRIEAEITKQIGSARAIPVARGRGALFSIETVSVPSPEALIAAGRTRPETARDFEDDVRRARRSTENVPSTRVVNVVANARTRTERAISAPRGEQFQLMLCQASAPDMGMAGSPRREALRDFKSAYYQRAASDALENDAQLRALVEAVTRFSSCATAGFLSAYEVGIFTRFGGNVVRERIRLALANAKLALSLPESDSGKSVDPDLRNAIIELNRVLGTGGDKHINQALWIKLNPEPL